MRTRGVLLAGGLVGLLLTGCGGAPDVPDVVGLSEESARSQLEEAGFRVDATEEYEEDAELGEVLEQDPEPGETIEDEEESPTVDLVVAGEFEATISGSMTLTDGFFESSPCSGSGGYDDMQAGTQVTVSDESGETIAVGRLESGEATGGNCRFDLEVGGVPKADIYEVEVSHRGGLSYTFEEMQSQDWEVTFSLG